MIMVRVIVAALVVGELLLVSCAAPPAREVTNFQTPRPRPNFPLYPDHEMELGRQGEVLAKCDRLTDGRVQNCVVEAVEGGDDFGQSV